MKDNKSRRRWIAAATALTAAAAATSLSPAAAETAPRPVIGNLRAPATTAGPAHGFAAQTGSRNCATVRTTWKATAQPHAAPEALFNAYSDTGKGWTGADSTYSVRLPGGRTAWIFSDTFLGPVNPDGSRPTTTPFINNSFMVQRGRP